MKKITIIILGLFFTLNIFAQNTNKNTSISIQLSRTKNTNKNRQIKTVFNGKRSPGFYLGINGNYGKIANEHALIMGANLAYVANRSFEIGAAIQGIYSSNPTIGIYDDNVALGGIYGGFHLAPVFFSNQPVHFSVPVLIGGGTIGYYDYKTFNNLDIEDYDWDVMFVIEPGLNVEFNISRVFRVFANAKYRFTSDVDINNLESDAFQGWSGGLGFKIGKF